MIGPARAPARLILLADLGGTLLFAFEGALVGIEAGLDLYGVTVLAFVASLGGGLIRDILIGATPAAALADARYPSVAVAGAAAAMLIDRHDRLLASDWLVALDAAALALFAMAGFEKARARRLPALPSVLMGVMTGCGGGALRDLLLARVPMVLRADIYATAALAGCTVAYIATRGGVPPRAAALLGGLTCFALRVIAASRHWQLPRLG